MKNKIPKKKQFDVDFYHDWCKSCGICMTFCSQKIIIPNKEGKPEIVAQDGCIGCRFCEMHCPDFAITVSERIPVRSQQDD
ncbi:MAG: 4Fe-4S binding protein [Candidatus Electrothrix gigas]